MTKQIEIEGKTYVYKTGDEWTLGDYAEVLDVSTIIDVDTLQLRQLRGSEIVMTITKGLVEPKMTEADAKAMKPNVARKLYAAMMEELTVPLSAKQS